MKKLISQLLVVSMMMLAAVACADSTNLSEFADRLMKAAEGSETETNEPVYRDYGPEMRTNDAFFEKVRSSAYLREDKYSKSANVMMELKNTSGRTLYPQDVSIAACNANGDVLAEKSYANYGPDAVNDGEKLFVWANFYSLDVALSDISYFEVTIESKTSSYRTYASIDSQALVLNGLAYALVENTLNTDIYGLDATIVVENDNGQLLDVCESYVGTAAGIIPGSTMILRDNAKDYANDTALATGNATAYVTYQLD